MCMPEGPRGQTSQELVAQENASKARAQAESDRLRAEQDFSKQKQNEKMLSDQVQMANADTQRRIRNRTLLSGIGFEEDENSAWKIEDPTSKSAKKAKRATLISSIGG